jgi:serine/threonine-protein kinase RsbW
MSEETKLECQVDTRDMTQPRAAASPQPLHPAAFVGQRSTLPSDVYIISAFIDQLVSFISRFRKVDGGSFEIELALREALVNAIVHGNQSDPRKRVYVNCRCTTDGEVSITVEDEGNGFEHNSVPDPTSPSNRLRTHGRGIYLIRMLMDEVHFEQSGSVIHMRKRANAGSGTTGKPQ